MLTPFMKSVEFKGDVPPAPLKIDSSNSEAEKGSGKVAYRDVLRQIHQAVHPSFYLEIGVRRGKSLRISRCDSIGVDPEYDLRKKVSDYIKLYKKPSDAFFREDAEKVIQKPVDLAFIDGMHLFEYVLWDFMNVEAFCHSNSLIVIDDVYPNHPLQASRERKTKAWTGDVWKLVPCLKKYRPDLKLTFIDAIPTGLLVVSNLDPKNEVLWKEFSSIEAGKEDPEFGNLEEHLNRSEAVEDHMAAIMALTGRKGWLDKFWIQTMSYIKKRLE